MITVDQIRLMIQQLILSEISLDDFEEQLAVESWNMHLDSEADAVTMAGRIELLLAEKDSGEYSENALLKNLGLIGGIFEMGSMPTVRVVPGASRARSMPPFKLQVEQQADADKRPALVFSYTQLQPV